MTDATELDEAAVRRDAQVVREHIPSGYLVAHRVADAVPLLLDEITRLRAALDEARAEVADAHHEGFGCGVAWAVVDDEEAPPALLARAEAAESALAAVRALADEWAADWEDLGRDAGSDPTASIAERAEQDRRRRWKVVTVSARMGAARRLTAALATPTTPEETR